jgi:hypothetical protein
MGARRRVERERALQHTVGIAGDDVHGTGPRAARRTALPGARQQHATTLRPIQLGVMDQPFTITGDHQILGEPEGEQPVAQPDRVIAHHARPDALLTNSTRAHAHLSWEPNLVLSTTLSAISMCPRITAKGPRCPAADAPAGGCLRTRPATGFVLPPCEHQRQQAGFSRQLPCLRCARSRCRRRCADR